jgi:peptidyl-prolyl cis-trans isomerase D
MAAIGQIRKHSTLLLLIIGGAMALFVLGGALESSTTFFSGPTTDVGSINGSVISYQEFEEQVAALEQNSQQGLTEQEKSRLRDQVWNNIIQSKILDSEYRALGLAVTDEEIFDIIKNDPNNANLKQYFTNPQTGQIVDGYRNADGTLNGAQVIEYLKQAVFVDNDQAADSKASWLNFQENYLRKPTVTQKYATLLGKSIFTTDADLEKSNYGNEARVSFLYTSKFYNDISDDEVEVTDADLKAYYNAHSSDPRFQQKEISASITFVSFEVTPSDDDKANIKAGLADLAEAFQNTTDDTTFINDNGDTPFNIRWKADNMFPAQYDTVIANASKGEVVGPFENAGRYELVKIVDTKMGPDSVKASHILIPITTDEATAKATADSLMDVAKAENNFADLATEFSQDPGSASKGGELGWFTEGQMVPEFNNACFNGKPGDMTVVTTQFGVHLIKIEEQTELKEKMLVGIVSSAIEPSQATYEKAFNEASTFAITNNNADLFASNSEALNSFDVPNMSPNQMSLLGRPNSRQVVRWAFESNVGEVSSAFDLGNEFVVAVVTERKNKGTLPLTAVKDIVETEVIKEKKAEMLIEKMQGTDVKSVASANQTTVDQVPSISFGEFSIPGLGNEQTLLGSAFGLESGAVSAPIQGSRGVYVIQIENKKEPEPSQANDAVRKGVMAAFSSRAQYEAFNALKNNADIEDNRYTFF